MEQGRKKKLLARVRKLLNQANGTTFEHEAHVAFTMAQEILLREGMTMAEVDALSAEEQKKLVSNEEVDSLGSTLVDWKLRLAAVVARNMRCDYYTLTGAEWDVDKRGLARKKRTVHVRMIGLVDDVAVARDVYQCARDVAERLSRLYVQDRSNLDAHLAQKWSLPLGTWYPARFKAVGSRELRLAWLVGFVEGLDEKFTSQITHNPSLALMLVIHPVVTAAVDELGLRMHYRRRPLSYDSSDAARTAGFEAGKAFEHQPPKRLSPPQRRLAERR